MKKPALNISFTLTCPDPKIIALGGVATGSINAHESDIVAGISTKRMSERKSTTEKKDYSPRNVNRSSPFGDSAAIAGGENKQYKRTQNGNCGIMNILLNTKNLTPTGNCQKAKIY